MTPPIVVWTEIPVTDLKKAIAFYNAVFDWQMVPSMMGPEEVAVFGGQGSAQTVSGNLVEGPAAGGTGPVVHIAVPDLAAATDRAKTAGAKVMEGPVQIPAGRYTNIQDPDGNRIGLFEPKAA
ncbi:VOC family protein [Pseudooceanicola sp. HF7]|uniref:VOC family protein n=1 Tax=Pseudooceanicola sp. HF7 TaxID=2721560 RepID=UPI00142FB90B|nr:VOC family protein [Pseudooceanicola sp. HF7]NIZ09110.1 VOC family protein [Pseudooceanicola sp. HF7]